MERFFTPTAGRTWESGTFGCVRGEGWQLHEGIDILCTQRDKHGEPTDPILATADGTVSYFNPHAALSNYGKYIVLQHTVDGLEVFSLYAHLSEINAALKTGQRIRAGEVIGIMGRTSNTRERITTDRAHLHFELNLFLNEHFSDWYKKNLPGERNDHGIWNGQNMAGMDLRLILLQQARLGTNFNLLHFVRNQTELCRVLVRKTNFSFLQRYQPLVWQNPVASRDGIVAYEVSLDYSGLPFKLVPRAESELQAIKGHAKFTLLSVNEKEERNCPCRKLVTQKTGHWALGQHGIQLLELLTW
ncbi:MAG: M23 family metallopeptidase [Verrucomicrobiota bacterium]